MTDALTSGAQLPPQQTIGPNGQAVFLMDYDPRSVTVQNTAQFDGQCAYIWIYASATPVTPTIAPLQSGGSLTLRPPPPDSWGGAARTLLIYNTGGATLTCTQRSS